MRLAMPVLGRIEVEASLDLLRRLRPALFLVPFRIEMQSATLQRCEAPCNAGASRRARTPERGSRGDAGPVGAVKAYNVVVNPMPGFSGRGGL